MRELSSNTTINSVQEKLQSLQSEYPFDRVVQADASLETHISTALRALSIEVGTDQRNEHRHTAERTFDNPKLFDWLGDVAARAESSTIRFAAIELLGRIGGKEDVPILAHIARTGKLDIYEYALQGLRHIAGPEVEYQIQRFVKERDDQADRLIASDTYRRLMIDGIYDSSVHNDWSTFSGEATKKNHEGL